MSRLRITQPALVLIIFAAGLFVGWSGLFPNPISGQPAGLGRRFAPFWEVWQLVEKHYVDRQAVNTQHMTDGAIEGMLDSLGDTGHTRYLTREEAKQLDQQIEGEMEGIGVRLGERQGRPTVLGVFPKSPAEAAGIKPGDGLLEIDGEEVKDKSMMRISELIRGKADTELTIKVSRAGVADPISLTLTRSRINVPDASYAMLQGRSVAHIAIYSFGKNADKDLKEALEKAKDQGAKGVILDVRENPGGLKDQTIAVTSEFVAQGDVFIEQDAEGHRKPERVTPGGVAPDIPMVVLIDGNSASASEIFAGSIQDHGRAKLVGTKTFGTGTVLGQFRLSDGSAILLAISEWLTPKGRRIWHEGITPDVVVPLPPDATILLPDESGRMSRADLERSSDKQLLKALEVLEEQLK